MPNPEWVTIISRPKLERVTTVSKPDPEWVTIKSRPGPDWVTTVSRSDPQRVTIASRPNPERVTSASRLSAASCGWSYATCHCLSDACSPSEVKCVEVTFSLHGSS